MKIIKITKTVILTLVLLILAGCSSAGSVKSISPEDALTLLEDNSNIILLDVRTPEEYSASRIPGSTLVPDYDIKEKINQVIPDKNTPVIVYCRSGRRSAIAAEELIELGYKVVYDLGGILSWPYETESDNK